MSADATEVDLPRSSSSFWHAAWYRYRRNRLALVSGVVAVVILVVAALATLIAPYGYAVQDLTQSLVGPSLHHLLGTDELGGDLLSRAIYGARTSMSIAIGAPLLGALIGLPIGIISGWLGGLADYLTLRAFEVFTMVPQILMVLLLIAVFGSGVFKLILFLGVTSWAGFGRLARAQYIALRDRDFVVAERRGRWGCRPGASSSSTSCRTRWGRLSCSSLRPASASSASGSRIRWPTGAK